MSSRRIGNYQIIDYVGSGGFGSVFKAEEVGVPGRIVAIKELHKKHTRDSVIKQRFFQEAVAMARLDHPSLPRLFTFGEDNGSYYLVMEFISGRVLSDAIAEHGAVAPDRAMLIVRQVLDAVSYAHKNGIIHRDLKPDNIILVENSGGLTVKVLDFGIARMIGGGNLTLTGEGFGTPAYMAPERITAAEQIDHRIDVYSVGIILFEMISGKVPFSSNATDPSVYWAQMRQFHENEPLPSLASLGISPDLEAVMVKATAKLPAERYASAEDMLAALKALESEGAIIPGEQMAGLLVTTQPGGAEVLIDDLMRGVSDQETGRMLIEGLASGPHRVRVSRAGYNEYRIDVLLEEGRRTDLQVALAARATAYMPRPARTGIADPETDKIAADEEITQVLAEGAHTESTALPGKAPATEAYEEAATIALAPVAHPIEPTPPSGVTRKNVVTVTGEESGALKTVRIASDAETPGGTVAIAPVESRFGAGRLIATGAAVLLLLALAVASYFVLRGPAQVISAAPPPEQATQEAAAGTATGAASTSAQEDLRMTELEKKVAEIEKRKAALEAEAARREAERAGKVVEVTTGKPSTPVVPEPPAQAADACASVLVLNAAGQPAGRRRVALFVQSGTPNEAMTGGLTDGGGRWQHCGLKAGQKVMVRIFGPARAVMATRTAILQPGNNQLAIKLDRMDTRPQASRDQPDEMAAPSRNFHPNRTPNPFKRRRRP